MSQPVHGGKPDSWVPAEDRVGTFDRRGLGLSITALAIAVLWAVVMPSVASVVTPEQEIEAGTVLDLGSGASMRPAPGWVLQEGAELGARPESGTGGPATTVLHDGAVTLTIEGGVFEGDLASFMDTLEGLQEEAVDGLHLDGHRTSFETVDGVDGLHEGYLAAEGEGLVGALIGPAPPGAASDAALEILAEGPRHDFQARVDAIEQMVRSIQFQVTP
jgi:hypothetical protein